MTPPGLTCPHADLAKSWSRQPHEPRAGRAGSGWGVVGAGPAWTAGPACDGQLSRFRNFVSQLTSCWRLEVAYRRICFKALDSSYSQDPPSCPGRLLALLLGSLGSTTGTQQAGSPFISSLLQAGSEGTVAPKDIQALVLGACEDRGWAAARTAGDAGAQEAGRGWDRVFSGASGRKRSHIPWFSPGRPMSASDLQNFEKTNSCCLSC